MNFNAKLNPSTLARCIGTSLRWMVLAATVSTLVACGGTNLGGGTAVNVHSFSGTVGSGAPMIGTVTIKDSSGATRTVPINSDGTYTITVMGLQAPFVFMAEGTVGARHLKMVSAATADDLDKTINISPFTDLIVANVAGQLAETYFDSPTFSKLTTAELNSARQVLTERLKPVLTALGVADSFDILRSSFALDHTGFDAVMDVLRVTTDAATRTATIEDLVNHTHIQDDLTSKTDLQALPAPVGASLADTAANLRGIESTLGLFSALFATSVPAADDAALRALMSSNFVDWGGGVDGFLSSQGVLVSGMVGARQYGASIVSIADNGATIDVTFTNRNKDGSHGTWEQEFRRDTSGRWQYAGNRRSGKLDVHAQNARFFDLDASVWNYRPNVGFWVYTRAPSNAAYAVLSGPGLATWTPPGWTGAAVNGVVLGRTGDHFSFYTVNNAYEATWLADCALGNHFEATCVDITRIAAGAAYTVSLLDSQGQPIGTPFDSGLSEPPRSAAESSAHADAWFPSLASSDPATLLGFADGKTIVYTLVAPTDPAYGLFEGHLNTPVASFYTAVPAGSNSVNVGVWSGAAPTHAETVAVAIDAGGARFNSFRDLRP